MNLTTDDSGLHPWRRICRVIGGSITSGMTAPEEVFAAVWRAVLSVLLERHRLDDRAPGGKLKLDVVVLEDDRLFRGIRV